MYCKSRFRSFGQSRGDFLITCEAEFGDADFPIKELVAELAFGLDAAQFGGGSMEEAMGLGAGAVHRLLLRVIEHGVGFAVRDTVHACFDDGAAAKTPGSVDDFGGKRLFDGAFGYEVYFEAGAEFRIETLLLGADEVAAGVEPG